MAYRGRSTTRYRAAPRRPARGRAARAGARTGSRRMSRASAGRAQTVRVVIEQAPPSAVARGPISTEGLMQTPAGKPQKAKF